MRHDTSRVVDGTGENQRAIGVQVEVGDDTTRETLRKDGLHRNRQSRVVESQRVDGRAAVVEVCITEAEPRKTTRRGDRSAVHPLSGIPGLNPVRVLECTCPTGRAILRAEEAPRVHVGHSLREVDAVLRVLHAEGSRATAETVARHEVEE